MSVEDYFYSSQDTEQIERVFTGAVLFNTIMNLSPNDQALARLNIGAGSEDRNFGVTAYVDSEAELPAYAEMGSAYGVRDLNAVDPSYIVSEYISPDGIETAYELNDTPNTLMEVEYVPDHTVLIPIMDYTYFNGVITFASAPASGIETYKVTYVSSLAPPVYNIFVWDSLNTRWVNNGPLSVNTSIIGDNTDDLYHTFSTSKVRQMFSDLMIETDHIEDDSITDNKIVDGAVSHIFMATIGIDGLNNQKWFGAVKSEYLSPDGATQDFTLEESPPDLIKIEFIAAGVVLTPGVDYIYSGGVIHFATAPGAGIQTYEVDYYSTKPPFIQEIEVEGLLGTDTPVIDMVPSPSNYELASSQIDAYAEIYKMVAEDDTLLVYAHYKTTTEVPIKLLCVRK